MTALTAFQNGFAQALLAPYDGVPENMASLAAQPGFTVYRNTVMKACVHALQANYPAVARLTGEEWFRSTAAAYARENPPDDPVLLRYGATFADFLANFEPAATLPWLTHVAQLDRFWIEAHIAANDTTLDPAAIALLKPEKLAVTVLYPHPAARWAWFADAPIFSIWSRNREGDVAEGEDWEPEWKAEGVLLARLNDTVEWVSISTGAHAFLEQCARGSTLAEASEAAMTADASANLQQIMALLLRAGAFSHWSAARGNLPKLKNIF